jgi:kynureninase
MPDRPGHFHRHRFPAEVISYAVWLYYRFIEAGPSAIGWIIEI